MYGSDEKVGKKIYCYPIKSIKYKLKGINQYLLIGRLYNSIF